MKKFFVAIALPLLLISGCTTTSTGIKNPEFQERKLSHAAVLAVGGNLDLGLRLEAKIVEALSERGVKAIGVTKRVQFHETQEAVDKFNSEMLASGVRDAFYFSVGAGVREIDLGSRTYANTTFSPYGGSATTTATTVPVRGLARDMGTAFQIRDAETRRLVWKGGANRHAQGLLFIGDDSMSSAIVDELIEALIRDGLI